MECKSSVSPQNAGAVIGKGGKNIKALRTDVSKLDETLRVILQISKKTTIELASGTSDVEGPLVNA